MHTIATAQSFDNFPLWVLFISVAWVIISIARFKMHPFLAMMSGAVLVGLLSGPLPEPTVENKGLFHNRVDLQDTDASYSNLSLAVKWSLGFGNTAGGIGLIIALAAIVGTCMMKSEQRKGSFVICFLFLERNELVLYYFSGFLLSIPVFFDTVFFLLFHLPEPWPFGQARDIYIL